MAAGTAVFQSLFPGDHVVVSRVMYWALRKWLIDFAMPFGLRVEFVDPTDLDAVAAAMRPGRTRLVWIETPANPTWEVTDIEAVAQLAHRAGARLAVDTLVRALRGDRVGLIAYAGDARVLCPLTLDHSAARMFLDSLDVRVLQRPGTAIGSALGLAGRSFVEESSLFATGSGA